MRFKRAMAASMAAVMAVSSAVVCQVTASAAANKTIELSGFSGWGATVVDSANSTISFASNYGGCGYWNNPGLDGYDELVLTYHDLTTDALTLVAQVDKDNKAEKYANNASGEIVVDITDLDRSSISSLMITGGKNAGSVVIDSIIARSSLSYGDEKVLWSGTSVVNETYVADSSVDLSKLSDNAVFTITLNTDNSEEVTKGWGIGQVVANDVWTEGKTVAIASPGQNITNGTFSFTKKQLLDASGETSISSLKIQPYKSGATLTKLTVKDVEQSDVAVSSLTIEGEADRTATYGDSDVTLTATANADATDFDETKVTWTSSDTDVATVSADGKVTFVGAGSATIKAIYDGDDTISGSVKFTVAKKKVPVTIKADDVTGATTADAAEKAKAAVLVVAAGISDEDYTVDVKVDGKTYTAAVKLTDEAAKKYELTGDTTAEGTISYKVTNLKLSADKLSVNVTSTAGAQLTVTAVPDLAEVADGDIEWASTDDKIAKVSSNGLVTPVAVGNVKVTATLKSDKTISASCDVIVFDELNPAVKVELDKAELSGTAGEKADLKAAVTAEDTTKDCTDNIVWASSNEKVATVVNGTVTFVGEGTADITATAGEASAVCKVTVKAATVAVDKVTLDKTSAELTVGDTATIKATVTPDNATDKTVTWTSSDESVATVKDGVVTAVKAGKATITAKAGDKTADCAVTVKAKEEEKPSDDKPTTGKETEIWTGNTDLGTDWSKSVTVPKSNVKIGDTIRIKVSTGSADYHQIKIMDSNWKVLSSLKGKAHEEWGTIDVDKDGYVEFTVNAADAKLISEGGLIITGYDLTISSVAAKALKDETYAPSTKVQTVVNNGTSQIAVFAISEKDAETYESYTVTITRGSDGKKVEVVVNDCYKYVTYNNGTDDVRVSGDGAYYILLEITNIKDSFGGITVKIEPTAKG